MGASTESPGLDPLDGLPKEAEGAALVFTLLALTLLLCNIAHKQHIPVPEAIITVCVGLLGGALSHAFPEIKTHTIKSFEDMSARWFMITFIAPIMFAEGYGLKSRAFFQNM